MFITMFYYLISPFIFVALITLIVFIHYTYMSLESFCFASLIIDNKVNAITLKSLKVFAGTGEPQRADMTLDVFGEVKKAKHLT